MCVLTLINHFTGETGQRQVRHLDVAQDRRTRLRPARGHRRGETEDGDDRLRLPYDQRLPAATARKRTVVKCLVCCVTSSLRYVTCCVTLI